MLLTIVSMICWGSWANTLKLSGNRRFELFYFDYSLGVLVDGVSRLHGQVSRRLFQALFPRWPENEGHSEASSTPNRPLVPAPR